MQILVCVKRVPTVGGKITLTADGQDVDTRMSGFTISPHEECAVEEAVQIVDRLGGSVTVLTLGAAVAAEQLREALALGASRAVLLQVADGDPEFGPIATAAAIATEVRGHGYDLVLLGNEASDTGDYQVGIRLAHLLGWPVATGIKSLSVAGVVSGVGSGVGSDVASGVVSGVVSGVATSVVARREYRGMAETCTLPLPAVVTVKEGINLPRYPSLPGRLRAKRAAIETAAVAWHAEGLRKTGLRVPETAAHAATVLGGGTGSGADAVPELVRVLDELGVL